MKLKLWMKVLIGVVALLILAVIAIPLFVNANTFRPMLEKQLANAIGRPVKLGDLSLSLLAGELVAKDISIAEDPAYGTTPFIQASSLKVGVEMKPLIFDHALRVTGLSVDGPKIHIVHGANGSFNFSNLGKDTASPQEAAQKDSSTPDLKVDEIKITDGVATVDSLPSDGPSRVYDKVNLAVNELLFRKQIPFHADSESAGRRGRFGQGRHWTVQQDRHIQQSPYCRSKSESIQPRCCRCRPQGSGVLDRGGCYRACDFRWAYVDEQRHDPRQQTSIG